MSTKPTTSVIPHIFGATLVVVSVLLGYTMRGNDIKHDARLEQMKLLSDQLTVISERVKVLTNQDQSYWNGYSEGISACYHSQK